MCTWSIITTSYSELKCCCSCAVQQNNRQCSINTLNRVGNSPVPTAVSTTSASHMPVLSTWKYCGTLFQLRIWFRILKLYQIKEVIQIETKPCRTLSVIFLLLLDQMRVNELLVCSKKHLYFLFSKGSWKQDLLDLRVSACYPAVEVLARGAGCVQGCCIAQCFPCIVHLP